MEPSSNSAPRPDSSPASSQVTSDGTAAASDLPSGADDPGDQHDQPDNSSPSASGTDDLSMDDEDEDRLLSYDPTPSHNPYPAPKWFSVKQLQAREVGCQAVSRKCLIHGWSLHCAVGEDGCEINLKDIVVT